MERIAIAVLKGFKYILTLSTLALIMLMVGTALFVVLHELAEAMGII